MQVVLYQKTFDRYLNSFTLFFQLPIEIRNLIFEKLCNMLYRECVQKMSNKLLMFAFLECKITSKLWISSWARTFFIQKINKIDAFIMQSTFYIHKSKYFPSLEVCIPCRTIALTVSANGDGTFTVVDKENMYGFST